MMNSPVPRPGRSIEELAESQRMDLPHSEVSSRQIPKEARLLRLYCHIVHVKSPPWPSDRRWEGENKYESTLTTMIIKIK